MGWLWEARFQRGPYLFLHHKLQAWVCRGSSGSLWDEVGKLSHTTACQTVSSEAFFWTGFFFLSSAGCSCPALPSSSFLPPSFSSLLLPPPSFLLPPSSCLPPPLVSARLVAHQTRSATVQPSAPVKKVGVGNSRWSS